jgi:hypothetical protein
MFSHGTATSSAASASGSSHFGKRPTWVLSEV